MSDEISLGGPTPEQSPTLLSIIESIKRERHRHQALGYSSTHDSEHGGVDHLIQEAVSRLEHIYWESVTSDKYNRSGLIQVAAIIVAAIETMDNQSKEKTDD